LRGANIAVELQGRRKLRRKKRKEREGTIQDAA